jgi:hypothetical protein
MGLAGARSFIINQNFRETGNAGGGREQTGRFNAGNGRYPGGTPGEMKGIYPGQRPQKNIAGLEENNTMVRENSLYSGTPLKGHIL